MASPKDIRAAVLKAFGKVRYLHYDAGILVKHQAHFVLAVPTNQIDAWVKQQLQPDVKSITVGVGIMAATVKAGPDGRFGTPDDVTRILPKSQMKQAEKKEREEESDSSSSLTSNDAPPIILCPECGEGWEACDCGCIWCPFCGYEIPSQTTRGRAMHIKSKHPEVDWEE